MFKIWKEEVVSWFEVTISTVEEGGLGWGGGGGRQTLKVW
jgi:hypothetical protein